MSDLAAVCERAAQLLVRAYGELIRLSPRERLNSDHIVLRCAVEGAHTLPATLILKQRDLMRKPEPHSFDQSVLFANEWATLSFLGSLAPGGALGPRLYADDRSTGLVLLEDLGAVPSAQVVLYGDDAGAAANVLAAMGAFLGRLQAATWGHEPAFISAQAVLGASTTVSDASLDCRAHLSDLHACLQALGIAVSGGFDGALADLEARIHGPGQLRVLVHNDAGPHNFLRTPDDVRLLDYEFAGFGHALLDVVCARLAFPPAFRGRVTPPEHVERLEASYRAAIIAAIPMLADDGAFEAAVCDACAHWAYSKLVGLWRGYLHERLELGEARDQRTADGPERAAFLRRQVFTYLRLALETLEARQRLPELRAALARIVGALLAIWPETPLLPGFPAFDGEPWRYP